MEKLQKSGVLKNLGLDEKNTWILYDEAPRDFFEHLAANLDEANILTEIEYEQYKDLLVSSQFLEGDALTEELKELESQFPGILEINDDSIEELEQEFKQLESEQRDRVDRIARMEETVKQQRKYNAELEMKSFDLDYQEDQVTKECIEKVKKLSELQESNQLKIVQLTQTYMQPQNPPVLLYQLPLEQNFHKCEQVLGQLEMFIRMNFNITNACVSEGGQQEPSLNSSILEIKHRIYETEKKIFEVGLEAAGWRNVIENIDKYRSPSVISEMRAAIDDLETECEGMSCQLEVIQKEALALVEQSAEQEMVKVFHEHFEIRNKRALQRLETITSIKNVVENVTLLCELLWAAMQLDLERLKNRVDNSEEVIQQVQDCVKRIRQMKNMAKNDPVAPLNKLFLKKMQDVLIQSLSIKRDRLSTISECLQEYIKIEENMQVKMKSCVSKGNLSELHKVMNEMDDQTDLLREIVFYGPTNRPVIYDSKFSVEIHVMKQETKAMESSHNNVKTNYKKNIVEQWENDKFFKMDKNLWIYFLTEPKKVLACIKEIQGKAAEKGTKVFKALNINLSKAN